MNREKYIRDLIDKWKPRLGLDDWIINLKIKNSYESTGEHRCEAAISDDLKYLEADLEIYKPFWKITKEKQEITIVHELVHLLLCPLHPHYASAGDDIFEQVTQKLAITFFKQIK